MENSIEELREILAKQILELAIDDENPQFKLDAYRATAERGTKRGTEKLTAPTDGMTIFQERVKQATNNGTRQPPETNC
jgi:hypothetical protein